MRFRFHLTLIGVGLVVLLALVAGAAYLFRNAIVTGLAIRELAARGLVAELAVTEVGPSGITIENLAVDQLRIGTLNIVYSLRELLSGKVRVANIEGIDFTVDLTGEGPPLGGLQQFLPSGDDAAQPARPDYRLPEVTVSAARIMFLLPGRQIETRARGELRPTEAGSALSLEFSGTSEPFIVSGRMNAALNGTALASLAFDAELYDRAEAVAFNVTGESDAWDMEEPDLQFRLSGNGSLPALLLHAALEDALHPTEGSFSVSAEGGLRIPLAGEDPLRAIESDATFTFEVTELALPPSLEAVPDWARDGINGAVSGNAVLADGILTAAFETDISYSDEPGSFELSAPQAQIAFGEGFSVADADMGEFTARAHTIPTPFGEAQTISLDGSLSDLTTAPNGSIHVRAALPAMELGAITARSATIDAGVSLETGEDTYRVSLTGPASIAFGTVFVPAFLPIENLRARILSSNLVLATGENGVSFQESANIELPPQSLRLERQDEPPMPVEILLAPIDIELASEGGSPIRLALSTTVQSAALPDTGIRIAGSGLEASGLLGGELTAAVTGGAIMHQVEAPLFTPLEPMVRLVQNGDRVSITGNLRGGAGTLDVAVDGAHDLNTASGEMQLSVSDLLFGPAGASGQSLSPLLASMEDLRGRIAGEANLSWDEDGLASGGNLSVEDMSFRRDGMTIQGLDTELTFSDLLPAQSLPSQHLTIERIVTGIEDITALDLRYQLVTSDDGAPRVLTESLSMNLLGGRILAEGGTIDPATGQIDIPLRAEDLDLSLLLARIGLDELTGEGALSGTIPLRIGTDGAAIDDAALSAGTAGIVAYRSERAREALASGGDAVDLMLDALEDFHYDTLSLTLDKPVAGDTMVTLRLGGNNPAVLEGHPFDLNISLSGNADPLLDALLAGQRISQDLLRSITVQEPFSQPE